MLWLWRWVCGGAFLWKGVWGEDAGGEVDRGERVEEGADVVLLARG